MDQITKWIVVQKIPGPAHGSDAPIVVIDSFFELVHYGNTGAAWSMFSSNNFWLAIFSVVALVFLWVCRRQFGVGTMLGQVALGLMLGGVTGNLIDRVVHHHVVDFLQFYIPFRFPAFNVADGILCRCGADVPVVLPQTGPGRDVGGEGKDTGGIEGVAPGGRGKRGVRQGGRPHRRDGGW